MGVPKAWAIIALRGFTVCHRSVNFFWHLGKNPHCRYRGEDDMQGGDMQTHFELKCNCCRRFRSRGACDPKPQGADRSANWESSWKVLYFHLRDIPTVLAVGDKSPAKKLTSRTVNNTEKSPFPLLVTTPLSPKLRTEIFPTVAQPSRTPG